MPIPILDLDNFESDLAEGCEYVLTSPRSLQACNKLKLKPVQLLKLTLSDILNEAPTMSIRSAREKLASENEHRDDLLQKARMVRSKLVSGKALNESDLLVPQKSASLSVLPSAAARPVVTSPTRSISSPHVPPLNYKTSSLSMPASLASGRSSTSSRTRQNDRLVSSLVRKYAERRKEVKQARQKWLQWEEEKAEIQRRKVKAQKAIQNRAKKSRIETINSLSVMVEKSKAAEDVEKSEREKRLNDKMRKAELIAREKRAEREARIKENAKEEERKLEKQRARLEQNKRQSEMREKELAINLDKKLSEAEKTRKIKKLREYEAVHRRNHLSRRQFESNYIEVSTKREAENRRKEQELTSRLEQAKANNKLLMAQRSEALRVAAQKRKSQIEEVQTQRESILRLQQDRIQAEVLKNKKEQEAAILGLQQLKKQQLEQAKERHEYERQRALQNIERSKREAETEKEKLEKSINQKDCRSEQLKKERERTVLLSKTRAKKEGIRRELIKKDLETFDERARRAEVFAHMIPQPSKI